MVGAELVEVLAELGEIIDVVEAAEGGLDEAVEVRADRQYLVAAVLVGSRRRGASGSAATPRASSSRRS